MNLLKIDERTTINLDLVWKIEVVTRVEQSYPEVFGEPGPGMSREYQVVSLHFAGVPGAVDLTEEQSVAFLGEIRTRFEWIGL